MNKKTKAKKQNFELLRRLWQNKGARAGVVLMLIIVLASVFAPLIAPYDPNFMDVRNRLSGVTSAHIMGTDNLGRDTFSRILYGGRYSLILGICGALVGNGLGIIFGSVAGYFGGKTETAIMRIMDVWSSIPGLLLSIIIATAFEPSFFNTVLALSLGGVPGATRMIRGQILAERSKEYIEAAHTINCSAFSIMFRHILPNVISPSIVSITMGIGGTITSAAGLSFIGLGVQPPAAEWGALLSAGKSYITSAPGMIMFPGLIIMITVMAINLIGDGFRDAIDPKLKK